jgi:hypothetical protein
VGALAKTAPTAYGFAPDGSVIGSSSAELDQQLLDVGMALSAASA